MGVFNCSMFCCSLLYVHSSIAIILMGRREQVALLNLSSWCLVMVRLLFLAVPRGCLQFVIVVFPDHTHLLFLWLWRLIFLLYTHMPTCILCRYQLFFFIFFRIVKLSSPNVNNILLLGCVLTYCTVFMKSTDISAPSICTVSTLKKDITAMWTHFSCIVNLLNQVDIIWKCHNHRS